MKKIIEMIEVRLEELSLSVSVLHKSETLDKLSYEEVLQIEREKEFYLEEIKFIRGLKKTIETMKPDL